ncbi:RNA 2',3'-cyclic phosphodiesterase [Nocardioides mangrovi]|uniref:RNA 2',3'-cyclic phosphodiesterase n=1 Tax=Nocardioides mangrovi TaxID=2874580 RepID=A0ABS7UJB3_9ACTN|nr:RNA 2',3'-cyclic phosphodiesterase [Nocardioides mangrovi]MBZ5740954.1 RNA 2',3'-cyclic phosphodiesterase [Nocardioides mangrovi]
MVGQRMFVALVPPDEAVADLDRLLEPRRDVGDLRWTDPAQVHVTLAFLAEVEDRRLDDLVERLERAAARRTAFEAAIAGGGAFPNAARARVVWAGLDLDDDGRTQLDHLATGCRAAAGRAGIAVDGQRFRPHLTIGRTRVPGEVSHWVRLLDGYAGPRWTADRITLVASHLGEGPRGRPRYESVAELPLGG